MFTVVLTKRWVHKFEVPELLAWFEKQKIKEDDWNFVGNTLTPDGHGVMTFKREVDALAFKLTFMS